MAIDGLRFNEREKILRACHRRQAIRRSGTMEKGRPERPFRDRFPPTSLSFSLSNRPSRLMAPIYPASPVGQLVSLALHHCANVRAKTQRTARKKGRALQRGQFNREEVNTITKHGLPITVRLR